MAGSSSPGQEGPDDVPPPLPEGWLAQWDGSSRKYYYVQRATGHSQWEVPTKPALSAPTPEPTPQGIDPFGKPIDTRPAPDADFAGQDRSLLGDLASGALGGGKQNKHASGLGGLAQTLLSNSKPSGGHTPANIGSHLLSSFLGGGNNHTSQASSSAYQSQGNQGSQTAGDGHSPGGLIGGLLHSHHGQQQTSNFGYNPGRPSGSGYAGQAPSATYTPTGNSSVYGPSSGAYRPLGTESQTNSAPSSQRPHQATQSNPFDGQSTPQPFNSVHALQTPQYQSPPPSQYQGSGPSTPAYGQTSQTYTTKLPTETNFGQYGQAHSTRPTAPNFPPPPNSSTAQNYAGIPGNGPQNFAPSSQPPPPYYSQGQQQQQQQQQQQHSSQVSTQPNFPPPPGQYNQHGTEVSGYPQSQGAHNPQSHQPQAQPHLPTGYGSSPAPPMHNHPSSQGFSSGSSMNVSAGNYASQTQASSSYIGNTAESYEGTYSTPPAPSWR